MCGFPLPRVGWSWVDIDYRPGPKLDLLSVNCWNYSKITMPQGYGWRITSGSAGLVYSPTPLFPFKRASWPDDARMFAILEKYCHFPTYGVNVSMKKPRTWGRSDRCWSCGSTTLQLILKHALPEHNLHQGTVTVGRGISDMSPIEDPPTFRGEDS